jgi:hypothetical protein
MRTNYIEGFWNTKPKVKKISFGIRGKIIIHLEDGRSIIIPISKFPSIKKLTLKQRKKWFLFGNGFSFDDSNEVYHLEQILGNFQEFKHELQT